MSYEVCKGTKQQDKIVSENTCEASHKEQNDGYTMKFVFSGAEDCEINNRAFRIHPDSFAVVNAGTNYISKIDSFYPVSTFSVSFGQNFVDDFFEKFSVNHEMVVEERESAPFAEALYPLSTDMLVNILHLKKHLDEGLNDEMLINEYMHHCLLNYYKIYDAEVLQKVEKLSFIKSKTNEEILKRLSLAKEYISSYFNEHITLENIAEHSCLSVNHLLRTFKEAYEVSPYQYLMKLRLTRAQNLLQTTSYSLNEIVNLVGFECTSSFIRLFKSTFNITPLKYKKSRLN